MGVLQLLVLIIVIGVLVWLVETYIPMAPPFKSIVRVVAIVCVVLLLLSAFGILDGLGSYQVPRVGGGGGHLGR